MAVALITGCASSVGQLTALELAREGVTVYAAMRDLSKSVPLERAASAEGIGLELLELDVLDDRSVRRAVDRVDEERGAIDILVNGPGVQLFGAVHLTSDEEVRWQFEHDVLGMLRVVRNVVPVMRREGRGGTIVNVSALSGVVAAPYAGVFAAAKHAVEALSESLHFELRPYNIRVAVVAPGQTAVGPGDSLRLAERQTPDTIEYDRALRFAEAALRLTETGQPTDPLVVARTIAYVATAPRRPFRHSVGSDAALVQRVRTASTFEEFEQAMREALDWWE